MQFILFELNTVRLYKFDSFEHLVSSITADCSWELFQEARYELLDTTYAAILATKKNNLWHQFTDDAAITEEIKIGGKNFLEGYERTYPERVEKCKRDLEEAEQLLEEYGIPDPFGTSTQIIDKVDESVKKVLAENDKWMDELLKNPVGRA